MNSGLIFITTCSLAFIAVGNNSVALDANGAAKNPQTLIKGDLVSPVVASPLYFLGPSGHDEPGCSAGSKTPTWAIETVNYEDRTGDGIDSIAQRSLNFVVTNPATGYDASCMTSVTPDGEYPPDNLLALTCAGIEFQSPTVGRYSIQTTASFEVSTSTLTINQTWYCDDEDPGRP